MPVERLVAAARTHDALVSVDAIQALGVVPVDVRALGADIVVGGSHKWLMGLEGLGFLYVRPDRLPLLQPRTAGWLSHEDPLDFLLQGAGHLPYDRPIRRTVDYFEGTSANALGAAALDASLGLLLQLGIPQIHAHVTQYLDALEDGLLDRGFTSLRDRSRSSGILSVLPPGGDSVHWNDALNAHGVGVSAPDGRLRLSPHWANALTEIPRVLSIVDTLL